MTDGKLAGHALCTLLKKMCGTDLKLDVFLGRRS